ncbi:MAG TPA: tRNA 2-thiouridine(34) synthase MnmA, partial [Candidatus Paceibacterota bacterium]|nr:tRNA 2-thiouridine(34) synthase MnmA [Candidatus Paceibacterota bacterium]
MSSKSQTVFVGMSGGVDSSVTAALLKKEGYDVVGVFIKAWEPAGYKCTWREDRRDAMRVAAVLEVPFVTLDLEEEYKESVVDYMIGEYRAGRTPNPDVMCNQSVKFGAFYRKAREAGADWVATGHYAQMERSEGKATLKEGADKAKDQSYFLWTMKKEVAEHVLLPIGPYQKPEVRKLAEKFKLPNFAKKDSQGLCFLGHIDVKEFLKAYIDTEEGKVLNEKGEAIGRHDGAFFFTIGER